MTNQQKLRELINKACPDIVEGRYPCNFGCNNKECINHKRCSRVAKEYDGMHCSMCKGEDSYEIKPTLSHLLIALDSTDTTDDKKWEYIAGYSDKILYFEYHYVPNKQIKYDLTKPLLEQSEETLTELISLLS